MTKEYLLYKTLYGVGIIHHIIRQQYPDHVTHIKGDDCGEAPDPIRADGTIIKIFVEKTYTEGKRLPDRKAKVRFLDGCRPDCDAVEFASLYYVSKGEPTTEQQTVDRLAKELYIREPGTSPYAPKARFNIMDDSKTNLTKPNASDTPKPSMPPCPQMSFYRRPVKNTIPCRNASPQDIFKYLVSDYARRQTRTLRSLPDVKARRRYKAENFDYITPGGIFRSRKESDLVSLSGYIVIDYDHVPDPHALLMQLIHDPNFETVLAFRSPSGDGIKWIVERPPGLVKNDGTPFTHGEFFTVLANYSRQAFGIEADPSGKDICRACFLPYDPDAFLNPFYLENGYEYDITKFLHGTAQ